MLAYFGQYIRQRKPVLQELIKDDLSRIETHDKVILRDMRSLPPDVLRNIGDWQELSRKYRDGSLLRERPDIYRDRLLMTRLEKMNEIYHKIEESKQEETEEKPISWQDYIMPVVTGLGIFTTIRRFF